MKFAKIVFLAAGAWGILVMTPLFFLVDITGTHYAAPETYPHFFYGFLTVTMAWQFAFLVIGSDPVRYRPLMLPCMLEKAGYLVALVWLHLEGRVSPAVMSTGVPDLILLALFVAAFVKARKV
jgi:hypothetical protein